MRNAGSIVFLVGLALMTPLAGGCRYIDNRDRTDEERAGLGEAPPIRLESLEGKHLLVMQAPHSGWSFSIDRDEQDREGWILYVTIRRPDPGFVYPQRVVDKRVLSRVDANEPVRVLARVLDHDEKGSGRGYAPLPVHQPSPQP